MVLQQVSFNFKKKNFFNKLEITKILAAKIFQDINNHEGLQSLISYLLCVLVLGGDVKQNPFQHVHNLVFNTFNG